MLSGVQFPDLNQMWCKIVQSKAFKSATVAASAIGLVIFSFQALWVATMSVFTLQFFLMPLYFVVACAMITLGIHTLERHESTKSS